MLRIFCECIDVFRRRQDPVFNLDGDLAWSQRVVERHHRQTCRHGLQENVGHTLIANLYSDFSYSHLPNLALFLVGLFELAGTC